MNVAINPNTVPYATETVYAVIYARFSSHAQGEQSIEGQLSEAHKYAAARGYKVIHEYIDRAKSGRTDNRAEFQQMLKDSAKKQFQVIILWKVDRFGRNREEIALNKIKCKKNGVRVEYVAETIPNTPEGVILESVLEGFAEYYSLQLSQNVRRGLNESADKCQSTGGSRPLGYAVDEDKRYIIDPKTAPTVQLIFKMYAEGSTISEIIKELNACGLRTSKGKPFTKNSLHTILKNEKYTGVYMYNGKRIENGMPQIIDIETFQKVQEMLKINKRAPAHKWSRADYILTEKLFCGHCGTGMIGECGTSRNGARYNYYICGKRKYEKGCKKKAVRQDWIEPLILREIQKIVMDDTLMDFIADKTYEYYMGECENENHDQQLKDQLAEVEKGIQNIVKAVEAGMFNAALKDRMDELEEQKKELLSAIADNELSRSFKLTKDHIKFFLYQFRSMNFEDRECQKRLVSTFVNSIFVYDDKITLTFNYSSDSATVTLAEVDAAVEAAGDADVFGCCAQWPTIAHRYEHRIFWFGHVFAITVKAPEGE